MNDDEETQIEIEDQKLSIIQKDLEDKIQEYLSKRFEIDQKYIELSQIRKDIYNLKFEKQKNQVLSILM